MGKKQNCEGFRCPEVVPIGASDDFCIPEECCPERIEQPKFPSPSSCLPEEELEELEVRIAEINQILLDIALSNERLPREIFQRSFDGLVGQKVIIKLRCMRIKKPEKNMSVKGRVFLVGRDFVLLRRKKVEILVPFEQILLIKLSNRFADPVDVESLNEIDPCFRRDLTFNFGAVVASSPELIQIFFRLTIKIYLLLLIGKKVKVVIDGKKMSGTVCATYDESFTVKMKNEKEREIPINNVCRIVVF